MKNIYTTPNLELMNLSKDVITASDNASDPFASDIKWDLTATPYVPADLPNIG